MERVNCFTIWNLIRESHRGDHSVQVLFLCWALFLINIQDDPQMTLQEHLKLYECIGCLSSLMKGRVVYKIANSALATRPSCQGNLMRPFWNIFFPEAEGWNRVFAHYVQIKLPSYRAAQLSFQFFCWKVVLHLHVWPVKGHTTYRERKEREEKRKRALKVTLKVTLSLKVANRVTLKVTRKVTPTVTLKPTSSFILLRRRVKMKSNFCIFTAFKNKLVAVPLFKQKFAEEEKNRKCGVRSSFKFFYFFKKKFCLKKLSSCILAETFYAENGAIGLQQM